MILPFEHSYGRLPDHFYTKQQAAQVPDPQLIRLNRDLGSELGLDPAWLESPEGLAMLSGNRTPDGAEPLAQAYAGHQFGGFSPQLGDGRALLLGELIHADGSRRDLQLKGSGRTPYSRGGDGKSALGPVLREYLVSEAMHALGIPSTRALAAVTTGEAVIRQEGPVAGGIFTRIAASHIRVGTFEYFAAQQDTDAVQVLADYTIARHYPHAQSPIELLEAVIAAQASLIAQWMAVGFIHGVMNTDNCAVSGETIDFGPCAFMDKFDPQRVFSSIDRGGRYAWGNQPSMAQWNLNRLAETLLPLIDPDPERAIELATTALDQFSPLFQEHFQNRFQTKLALPADSDPKCVDETLDLLASQQVDFTHFFRQLTLVGAGASKKTLASLFSQDAPFADWFAKWKDNATPNELLPAMQQANPIRIPRNHLIEQAIQAGYEDDFALFHRLADAWVNPYEESESLHDLEAAPLPHEVVQETFCGT